MINLPYKGYVLSITGYDTPTSRVYYTIAAIGMKDSTTYDMVSFCRCFSVEESREVYLDLCRILRAMRHDDKEKLTYYRLKYA